MAIDNDQVSRRDMVTSEDDLLRLAGQASRADLLQAIRADAAPLQVQDDGWDEQGFMLFIGDSIGVGFEMTYPFTIAEFWASLARVEQTARSYSS
ncbi:MAG: hypothetical protein JWN61_1017 [Pseudonocardiales bacterium]|nr:hypothetical protein [Pseudonocardiales bacterium]